MTSLQDFVSESPQYRGRWAPVFLEPIPSSGERITVCIAAIGNDQQFKVVQVISPKVLACLYGESADKFGDMVAWIQKSLSAHLRHNPSIDKWSSPLSGAVIGEMTAARSTDLNGIINQGIRMSSSLGQIHAEEEEETSEDSQHFDSAVKTALLSINKEYKPLINQSINLPNSARSKRFGFFAKDYIANFSAVSATTGSYNTAMARIIDLEDLLIDQFTTANELEMLVSQPLDFSKNPHVNDTIRKSQSDRMFFVKEEAEKRKISCSILMTPEEIALHIHKKAA